MVLLRIGSQLLEVLRVRAGHRFLRQTLVRWGYCMFIHGRRQCRLRIDLRRKSGMRWARIVLTLKRWRLHLIGVACARCENVFSATPACAPRGQVSSAAEVVDPGRRRAKTRTGHVYALRHGSGLNGDAFTGWRRSKDLQPGTSL